ncbi:MAG: WYL domain-containing protein [Bacteroidales bacterium]|jgi:predicted DNA-binding transcriptional regulator YafY|nr:WYL domain-containing protein [Bacteroidales bacterium]
MSKLEATKRQHLIIIKLKNSKHATFKDIANYLQKESDLEGYNFMISKRTFYRDLDDIYSIYGISIEYDFSNRTYYIDESFEPAATDRMLEAFNMYHALKIEEQQLPYFRLEKRYPKGTEHLYDLLHAIKNHFQITFDYQKYDKSQATNRVVHPLVLKEFKNRWYIFAKHPYDKQIKCYGLDRMTNLETSNIYFEIDNHFDVNEYLKYCFGIISPNAEKPSEVILSFIPSQGKYIKSLPLHETQEIIKDTEDEFRIRLKIYLTHDFLMELLSYGSTVKIIKPKNLINDLVKIYSDALQQYEQVEDQK